MATPTAALASSRFATCSARSSVMGDPDPRIAKVTRTARHAGQARLAPVPADLRPIDGGGRRVGRRTCRAGRAGRPLTGRRRATDVAHVGARAIVGVLAAIDYLAHLLGCLLIGVVRRCPQLARLIAQLIPQL